MICRPRIMKEQNDLQKLNDPTMIIQINETDILIWHVYLHGPQDSPFEDGIFKIKVSIPSNYPISAPTLHFQTRIFHPNVHMDTGEVCLEVLSQKWEPRWTIESVLRAVRLMLQEPNPYSPLNCDAANLLKANDLIGYKSIAQYYTSKYAIDKHEYMNKVNVKDKKTQ
ncbi:unnamed protein product (macronuclear) [Paramecium tetraurelia]|uniref:UBC core domain-containing protein n=1 Tax=Paramecium tetraurelia TaxID=5888 RepID=A0C3F7_PARTE|nr:uncharacterized protein GSPATT00034803001 [Paramecium tetraurelia]CAK65324.1 unnamed protein product [Paramecium tetraurelia]|eukprot:XP_001432721.1 hypothetical protein (macronuclear) [Paramecium tetraurelia strain d4-2]